MEHTPAWLLNSLIYLCAAVVAVPLSKALGLGSIIGYLVAGIVIGPWGLGWISNVQDILHFAEFGVVLMLFLVGLELEPKRLWSMRGPIFGWGSAQVLGCAGAIIAVALVCGVDGRVAVVAGLGLALSSTAIALQVMGERNLLPTRSGQAGFAILLFQDVAAIPILALLPLLALTSSAAEPLSAGAIAVRAASILAVIAAVVLAGRLLVRPALRQIARSKTPEIFTAAALLLVVGIAVLMQWAGLSMALGAFLAGVLLADSEYRHELETDIEPFKGLLLGLFFIAVGMGIDFGVLKQSPWLVMGMVVGLLAVKALVMAALTRAMGLPLAERPVLTLLLAQGGEFGFVVFQAAGSANVVPDSIVSLLVGAVALSMLLGPLLLVVVDKWLMPRYAQRQRNPQPMLDAIQTAPIIVAGFGRYGQIVSRLLLAQGHRLTVLDHDADMVDAARQFGHRVFYGDATRLDMLRLAGAATAQVLVVAVDDVEQSITLVERVREHFPHLHLVARARDVTHWSRLRERGVQLVERELFESSLRTGQSVLELLGATPADAQHMANRFRAHNLALFEQTYPHYKDRTKTIAVVKQARAQLEEQIAQERIQQEQGREREPMESKTPPPRQDPH